MKKKKRTPETSSVKPVRPEKKRKNPFIRFMNLLTFLIIIGFSGFVFYRGWIQFSIPENHYALAFTKTGGYDKALMKAGEFNWRWENLFPTNMTLHIFELPWSGCEIDISGTLPSGSQYASILENENSTAFQYNLNISLLYRFNPDYITQMIEGDDFQFNQIENWYTELNHEIQLLAAEAVPLYLSGEPDENTGSIRTFMKEKILEFHPEAEIKEILINKMSLPDRKLYEETRSIYLAGIQASRAYTSELERQNADLENQLNSKINLLEDYGEVLTAYPVLLQYFNLEKDKIDPMILNWEETPAASPES